MRSSRRSTLRHHVAALAAVVAILGQALVPHVHVEAPRSGAPADACLVAAGGSCAATIATAATPHDGDSHRHDADCAFCRAQSDARSSLVPSALAMPLPAATIAIVAVDAVAARTIAVRSLAAPRAPPFAS